MGAEERHETPTQSTPARGPSMYDYSQSGYASHGYTPYTQQQMNQYQHATNYNHSPMRGAPHQFYGYHGGRGHVSPMAQGFGHVAHHPKIENSLQEIVPNVTQRKTKYTDLLVGGQVKKGLSFVEEIFIVKMFNNIIEHLHTYIMLKIVNMMLLCSKVHHI